MSFASSSMQTIMVRVMLILLGLAAGIIGARWLGVEGVGILALLILVKEFAFRFGNFGFGSAFAFFVARKEISTRRILRMAWFAGGVASVFSGIIMLAVWRRSFSPWNDIPPSLFYLCLPTIPLIFFNTYLQRILSGQLRITAMNVANVVMSTANLVLLVILVIVLGMGVAGAVLSLVLSDLLCFLYLVRQTGKCNDDLPGAEKPGVSTKLVYTLWCYGKWNYLLMFSNFFVEELPLLLLKSFSANNIPVGLFSKARGLGRQTRIVAVPVSQVLFPFTASSKVEEATRRTNTLCRNSLVVMVFCVALMALCIKPIILVLYGEAFLPAAKIFYALAPGVLFWPLGHFLGIHVAASGKPKVVFFASLGTLVVAAATCWFLIPAYGAVGSGISVSVIYATQTFFRLLVYTKVTGASISDVLLPCRADGGHYVNMLKMMSSRLLKRKAGEL